MLCTRLQTRVLRGLWSCSSYSYGYLADVVADPWLWLFFGAHDEFEVGEVIAGEPFFSVVCVAGSFAGSVVVVERDGFGDVFFPEPWLFFFEAEFFEFVRRYHLSFFERKRIIKTFRI